jgi:2-polyprenyl-3-methyl-5-hydroxy-6-metoxy-1,4-benzoquinol methylase
MNETQKAPTAREGYHNLAREEVLRLAPVGQHNVLDVGGGIGANASFLKSSGKAHRFTVVDLVAHERLPDVDAAYSGDLEDPALIRKVGEEEGPFDLILCLDVLEHLRDPWSVLRSVEEHLKPGGTLLVSVPNMRNYKLVLPLLLFNRFDLTDRGIRDRTHLRWFVRSSAIDLVEQTGLRVSEIVDHFDGPKKRLFNLATLGVFRSFLVLQFYISAIKTGK